MTAPGPQPRVLIVENGMTVTGGYRSIIAAAERERSQFDFHFVLPSGSALTGLIRAAGFGADELPFVELGRSVRRLLLYGPLLVLNGWRLARIARRLGATVLHSNDLFNLTPYVARGLLLTGPRPRLVTHVRLLAASFSGPFYPFWCWCARRFADRIVCVSEAVRQGAFADEPKAVVIYEPLRADAERHPPKTFRAADPAPGSATCPLRVVCVGNYIAGKGHATALTGFERAYSQNPNLRLDFYGGTMNLAKNEELLTELRTRVAAQRLTEVVAFHPFATDVEALMKAYDVVLNCSEAESFSLVCFEALQFGVPLIATDCGGPRELFEDEKSGFLVPVRDANAVADRLLRLAADPALLARFSAAGRKYVQQKFGQHDRTANIWRF